MHQPGRHRSRDRARCLASWARKVASSARRASSLDLLGLADRIFSSLLGARVFLRAPGYPWRNRGPAGQAPCSRTCSSRFPCTQPKPRWPPPKNGRGLLNARQGQALGSGFENESRASATRAPASSSLAPTPCPPGTQHATIPKPVDVKLVNDRDSTRSHTRTATMNSATTLPAAAHRHRRPTARAMTRIDPVPGPTRRSSIAPAEATPPCRPWSSHLVMQGKRLRHPARHAHSQAPIQASKGQALRAARNPLRAASPARNGPSPSTAHRRPSYRAARRPRPKTAAAWILPTTSTLTFSGNARPLARTPPQLQPPSCT